MPHRESPLRQKRRGKLLRTIHCRRIRSLTLERLEQRHLLAAELDLLRDFAPGADGTDHEPLNTFASSFYDSGAYPPLNLEDRAYYFDEGSNLWVTDGTDAGTKQLLQSVDGRNWGDAPVTGTRVLDNVVLRLQWQGSELDIYQHDLIADTIALAGTLSMRMDMEPNLLDVGSHVLLAGANEAVGEEVWRINIAAAPLPVALPFVVSTTLDVVDPLDGVTSLREAIANSNAELGTQQITFDLPTGSIIELTAGQVSVTDDVTIVGLGSDHLTVNAGGLSRIFDLAASKVLTLQDITIAAGSADNGGAIHGASSSQIVLQDSVLQGNTATAAGGAIYTTGRVQVLNSRLIDNAAVTQGGAIHRAGTTGSRSVTILDSELFGNTSGQEGGAIFLQDSGLSVSDSVFTDNVSQRAGGVISIGGGYTGLHISRSEFSNNAARGYGGAIHMPQHADFTVRDSSFVENRVTADVNGAAEGGAIFVSKPNFVVAQYTRTTIERSTFAANSATNSGGAVYVSGGETVIRNATLSNNSASSGGAVGVRSTSISGGTNIVSIEHATITNNTATGFWGGGGVSAGNSITIHNSIIAGNHWTTIGGGGGDYTGSIVAGSSFNIIGDQNYGTLLLNGVNGNQVGVMDPGLAPLADNGGLTWTHALLPSSPAINAGNPASTLLTDQRGFTRVGVPDIGAFESDLVAESPLRFELLNGNLEIEDRAGESDRWRLVLDGAEVVLLDLADEEAELGRVSFNEVTGQILVMAGNGNDELTIDLAAGDLIPAGGLSFDGGSGNDDLQILDNGGTAIVTPGAVNSNSGSVLLDEGLVTYTNVAPQTLSVSGSDQLSIQLPDGLTSEVFVEQSAVAGQMQVRSESLEFTTIVFTPPAIGLTVLGGSASDTITVASFADNLFTGSLRIDGAGGDDTVRLDGNALFAADRDLRVAAETVTVGSSARFETQGAGNIVVTADSLTIDATSTLSAANQFIIQPQSSGHAIDLGNKVAGQLSLTDAELDRITAARIVVGADGSEQYPGAPTGAITVSSAMSHAGDDAIVVVTARNIATSENWTTTHGDLTFLANQQPIASTGDFTGVLINGGHLSSAGTGNLTLRGRGGIATTTAAPGVMINNGAQITGGTQGTLTIDGQGGAGNATSNFGVATFDIGTTINTLGGNVAITGIGGGAGASGGSTGVLLSNTLLTAGAMGTVTIVGQGALSTGNSNHGVSLTGANQLITSSGGDVAITGIGGGSGSSRDNWGVGVRVNARIQAGGNGSLVITGQGGIAAGGNSQIGVQVSGGTISSSGGDVRVVGTGGGSGSGGSNYGVRAGSGGQITAQGLGNVTVEGQGGFGTFTAHHGVMVQDANSRISSSGGNVVVKGIGGGTTASSSGNNGVHVLSTAQIIAGGMGNVFVEGTAGRGAGGSHRGVQIGSAGSQIASSGGDVRVVGIGGTDLDSHFYSGIDIASGSRIAAGGVGRVEVVADISGTVEANNIALQISGLGSQITSGGEIEVTAIPGPSSRSIRIFNNDTGINTTGDGDVTIAADSLAIEGAILGTIAAGSGAITIQTQTPGTILDIGANDILAGAPRTLGISLAELAQFSSSRLVLGSTQSGPVVVSESIPATFNVTINSDVTLQPTTTFVVTVDGAAPGQFEQLIVTKGLTLDQPRLLASLHSVPLPGSQWTIIDKQSDGSIVGRFLSDYAVDGSTLSIPRTLGEGDVLFVDSSTGQAAIITYQGGDGNDVVMKLVDVTSTNAASTSGQLRDGIAATFDALPNWATRFNLSEISLDVPLLPGEFAGSMNLADVLGPLLSRPVVQVADDWAVIRSNLEAAGFVILDFPGDGGDALRVKYTQTIANLSGSESLKQESLSNLANLAATVNLAGGIEHAANLQLEFTFGVDADGFFMQGNSGLKLTTVATGNASGAYDLPLVDLEIAASGSLGGLLSVEVTPSDTSRRFRITDVATPPASWLSTDVDGTVRLDLTQTVQPLGLAFTGTWVATLTDSSHTGTSSDVVFPTSEEFLAKAVPWASHQATSMLGDQVAELLDATSLPLVNGRLPESAEDWHKVGFIAALAPLGLTGYVAVAGTDGIVNYLAQQGIIVEESLDQLKIQNLLAGNEIDFQSLLKLRLATDPTKFDPLEISYAPDYTGAGALSGLTLAGSFAASMLPAINLGLGIDRNGFHVTADSTLNSRITLSGTTTGTMGPFTVAATLDGTVSPRVPLAPADANQDGKIRPAELIGNLAQLRIEQSTFTGELGTDLTLGFLDYVDADGDSTNNSVRGGDPFRFSGSLGFSVAARNGVPVFEPDSFDIKNPDVNGDGNDDFTTRVLLENVVRHGRDQLTDILDVDELQSKLATLGNLVGSNTPIGELFNWNEAFSTLDPAKVANLTDVSPGTVIGGNLVVKEIVTFDQIQLWLNFGLPTQPVDLLQLQLNEFTATTESIEFDVASLLPQDMLAQGWTASAALRSPTLGGSLGFGVDSSASPFYLATGTNVGDTGPQAQSRLSGAVTVEISLANASLFDGRLVIEQANGQFTPNFAIDFSGTGGADSRLRLNELHQLANADASLFENTLDSLLVRLRGSMFLPGLTDENDDPIEVRVLGTLEGLGDEWSLSGEIASDQRLKLGGFTITELGVDVESRNTGATRSLTAAVHGELEVALGDNKKPLRIGLTGEITDDALHVAGSSAVDDQLIGPEATPLLWVDGVELTLDMTIPRLANAPIEGGISLSVATLDAFPKTGLKQAKAATPQNESPNEPVVDPEQLENDRRSAANVVGYYLGENDASVRERLGELVVVASDLIIFASQTGLLTLERNVLVDTALEAFGQLKADSSQAALDEFVAKKSGPVAIAVGKIGLPVGVESYQLPPEALTTGTDLGLSDLFDLQAAQSASGGTDDSIFYDPQTYRDIQTLGLSVGLEKALKRMLATNSTVPAEAIENPLVRVADIIELQTTESLLGLDAISQPELLVSTDPATYTAFTAVGRDVAIQRASKRLSVTVWHAPQWIVEDAEIKASDVVQFFTIAQQVGLSDPYRLTRDNVAGENLYQRIKTDGRETAYDYARKIAVLERYNNKFNTPEIRTLVFDSGITGHQLLALAARDDYPVDKLADPEFYLKITNPNLGVEGAIAWANGRILGGGLLDRLKFEPITAAFRATELTGRLHSSGRIELQVGTASLTLGEILKLDATGNTTADLPALKLDFDPTVDSEETPFIELYGVTASIPLVEVLPTATLESLSFSRRGLSVGELTLAKDDIDLDYVTADRISLTLPAQQIDFSDPFQLPKLDGIAFSVTNATILPDFGTSGLVEIGQLNVRYENGTFLATVPQFSLEFGPFTTNVIGAKLNLGLRNQTLPLFETPILEVQEATLSLKTNPTSDLTFTARRLRVLGGLDDSLLPRVRFSSISLGSTEGIGDALGFGDILPLDITNLTIGTNAELDENDELLITATGKFNVDLFADKLPFDPIIEIREQDTDLLPLILNVGGDGRITSNDDIDNEFSVSLIVGPSGLRLQALPGRITLGIDNFEVGAFVFEGAVYLGDFNNGVLPQSFGGYLKIDSTPNANPDRAVLANASALSDEEHAALNTDRDSFSVKLEEFSLVVNGSYTPAASTSPDAIDRFSILKLDAAIDLGLRAKLGPVELYGFNGTVSMAISEDRSDNLFNPSASFSFDSVGVDYVRFRLLDYFDFTAEDTLFHFTDLSRPLLRVEQMTLGSPRLGLSGTANGFELNRRGIPQLDQLDSIDVTLGGDTSVLGEVLGFFPIVVDGLGFSLKDEFYARNDKGEIRGIADASQFLLRVSGGMQSPKNWPEEIRWPFTAKVTDLEVDVAKVLDPTLGFPITNLTEIELGMEMTEIGPVKIGGNLVLGILREDPQPGQSIGDIIFARINTATGKFERATETTPGAIPLIYGRVKGVFSGFDISGGVDLVLSPLGPTQAKLIIPTSIPLGTTPLLLSEVSGGINFGVTALRSVEHASELLNDPIFLDPFEVDTAGIRASILAALTKGTPTLLEPFTVGLSGTVTTTIPGILTGEASFVVNVNTDEFGLDTSNPIPTINTGVRFLGTGLLSSFGIPIGRAGILIDQSDLFSPELAIAFSVPSPDSPLGFLFNNRADLSAKLEVGGANLVALVALNEFLTNVIVETNGLAFERLAAALNDAPNKPLAVLLAGPDASDDFEFTAEFLQSRLLSGEDALLPTPAGLQALLSGVNANALSERSRTLGKLFTAFIQEIPSLFFEVDTLRQAARGDIDAVESLAREGVVRLGELTRILVTSLLQGGIAAGDSFNPSLLIEGQIQPMFFGFPTSSGVGGSIRLDKTGLRVELDASVLDAIKTFMPQLAPAINLSPIGPLADQVTIDASLQFPDPTEFLQLLLDSFDATEPAERIRLVLPELPVGLDPGLLSNLIVVQPTLPDDYDPINHPDRYPYTIVTDAAQIADSFVQFTGIDEFIEAMQIGTAAPYSLELVDYLIDVANPLADHWQLSLIGTLSGYGFENLVEFAGLAFGPQFDDGEYRIRDVVKDRLRLVVDELPSGLPDALMPLVILVAPTFPPDYDPTNHPERYAYTIVIDEADIDGRFVKLQRVDRFEHVVRFGGFVAAGDLRLPRVLSDPFGVYDEIDNDRWPDGRSGFLPPLLPVVNQQRLEDELFEVIGEVGTFATESLAYAERLRNALTTTEPFSRIEFFLPSPAGFLDLDNYRVTSLDADANPFDAYASAFDEAAVTELFAAGYLTGWGDLDLLGINWGSARYDASLQGVSIEASLPILYGLELEVVGSTREISLLEMAGDLLDSPLSQAYLDSLDAGVRDGLNVVDLVLSTFGIDSLDAIQTAYRAGDDLIHLLPESMQSRLSQQQLRDAADYLTSLMTLLDIRVQVPVAAGQLELTSQNIFDFAIEVNESDTNRLATSVSDVGRALAVKLFGENFFTSTLSPNVVIPSDLAAVRVAAFTPLASEPIPNQPNTVEQNGGLRFGMELNIPGLFERSSATFEVQATEALADLDITDLIRIPNFKATVATKQLALPNLFQKLHPSANDLISLNDFAIRLERNSAGVFADLDGTLNVLDRQAVRAFGRLELRDAGRVVGVLKVDLNANESLSLGGMTLTGSFYLHINNTGAVAQFDDDGSTITIRPGSGLFVEGSLAVNGVTVSSGKFNLQASGAAGLSVEAFGQVNFLGHMRTIDGSFSVGKLLSGSLFATGSLSDVSDNRDLPMKGLWVVRQSAMSLAFSIGDNDVPTFDFLVGGKIEFARLNQTLDISGSVSSTGQVSLSVSDLPAFSFGLASYRFTLDLPAFTISADPAATSLSASVSSASATVPGLGAFTLPAMSFESDGSFSVTLAQQASFGIFKTSGRLVLRSLGSGSGIELAILDSTDGTSPRIVIDPIAAGQDNLLDITMIEFAIRSSGSIVAIEGGNATGALNRLGQADVLEITDASVQFSLHVTQGFYVSFSGARLRMFGGSPHAIGDISFSSAGLGHAGTSLGTGVSTLFNLTSFGLTKAFEKLGEIPGLAIERLESVQSALGVNLRLGDNGLEFAQANNDSRSFNLFGLNVTMKKLLVASNGVLQFDLVGDLDAFGIFRIEGADRMEFRRDESGAAQMLIARRTIASSGVLAPVPYSLTIRDPLAPSNRVVDITMFTDLLWRSNGSVTTPTGGTVLGEGRIGNDWLRLNANFALLSSGTTLRLEMSNVSLQLPFGAEKSIPGTVRLFLNGGFSSQPNLTTTGSGAFQSLFRINLGDLVNNAVAGFNAGNGLFDLNLSRENGLTLALRPNETIPLTIFGSGLTINSFTASTSGNFAADVTGRLTLQSPFDEFSRFLLAEASFKLERRANGPLQLWLNPSPATREYTLPFGGRLDLSGFVSTNGEFSLGGQLSLGFIDYRPPGTGVTLRRNLPSVTVYLTHQGMFVEGDFFGNGVIVSGRLLPSGTALLQVGNTIIPVVLPGGTPPPFLSATAQGIGGMWRDGLQAGKEILVQGLEELERRGAEVEKGLKDAAAAVQAGIEQGLDALNQLAEKGAKTLGNTFKIVLNVFNGPVDQGLVFLDTNGNHTFDFLDENGNDAIDIGEWFEPFAILVNGSAVLFVAEPFDVNGNGQIDTDEGTLIAISGTNLITGLPIASPMLGRIDGTVATVSPLTTLVTALAETYAIELNDAQAIVRDRFGLPEIDLLAINPWTATDAGNRDAADGLASHIAVANTVAQVVAIVGGRYEVSDFELHQLAYYSLAELIFSNESTNVDLKNESAIEYLLNQAFARLGILEQEQIIADAATVIANGNRLVLSMPREASRSFVESVARVEAVVQGQVAAEFLESADENSDTSNWLQQFSEVSLAQLTNDASIGQMFVESRLLDVQIGSGRQGRSFVQNIDLLFSDSQLLQQLVQPGRVQIIRRDLNGANPTLLTGTNLSFGGNELRFDFGAQGLGGNRNSNAGDGYYQIGIDIDGDGQFDAFHHFYRLLGDVNGDGVVDAVDRSAVMAAMRTQNANGDVNGDGIVNSIDFTLVSRALGRRLKNGLLVDE